jgi:hypothetical protein
MPLDGNMCPPQLHNLVFAILELDLQITLPLLQLGYKIAVALLKSCVQM